MRFVGFALGLGIKRIALLECFLPLLGLKGHDAVLRKIESVGKLPNDVLSFCNIKNFSMKQCFQLTRYDKGLLAVVFSWKDKLVLSAAVFEEILTNLNDYLRTNNLGASSLIEDSRFKYIIYTPLSPHKRTNMLRDFIKSLKLPGRTGLNEEIEEIKKEISLPENIDIIWDKSLEKKEVKVTLNLCGDEVWEKAKDILNGEKVGRGIREILNKL